MSSGGPTATPMPVPSSYSTPSNASGNRMQDLLNSIPIFTKILLGFNIAVEIIIFLFSWNIGVFAISSYQVLYNYEFYRIMSSAFVHVGLLHIAMNMSSLFQIGPYLEQQFGTIQFFFLTIWSVFAIGFLYVFSGW
jgi:membrane associated rhomboid family serine protease